MYSTRVDIGGIYWDNGKENGNYYDIGVIMPGLNWFSVALQGTELEGFGDELAS